MKLLLTTLSLDPVKGAGTTERTRQLAKQFAVGHSVAVAAIEDGAVAAELGALGVETYASGSVRLGVTVPLLSLRRIWRMVEASDAVHILGYWNMLSVITGLFCRMLRKPYVLSAAGEFALLASNRRLVALFHALPGRGLVRHARRLVAITDLERDEIIERVGIEPGRVVVVPNGVAQVSADGADIGFIPPAPYVLFVGRLTAIKGPDLLLEAFARIAPEHQKLRLVMAGPDAGMLGDLKASAQSRGIAGRVSFPGYLNEAQRTAAMQGALCMVIPSRSEAMSLVAVEAGLQALPVVVTDRCGLAVVEAVEGGEVCAASGEAIGNALARVVASPDRAERGRRWQAHVLADYRWPVLAGQLLDAMRSA